ncbi:MAG: glycine cleavage system protein R [Chromatiales bacterium]|nr:glycine cleavage system protein R [Chromatiales bacterium]
MTRSVVLTVIGPDRPGLVESISTAVADYGGNWLESRMARLAGQFSGIVLVQVADDQAADLLTAVKRLSGSGLKIMVEDCCDEVPAVERRMIHLELVGQDRPGIVRQISKALAALDINVEELDTDCESASMSGEMLFRANARLGLPTGVSTQALRDRLEVLADELMVDIELED